MNLDPNGADYLSTTQGDGAFALGVINPNEKTPGTNEFTRVGRAGADAEPGAARQRDLLEDLQPAPAGQHQAAVRRVQHSDPQCRSRARRRARERPTIRASSSPTTTMRPSSPGSGTRRRRSSTTTTPIRASRAANSPLSRRMANRWQAVRVLLVHQEAHSVHRQRRHVGRADLLSRHLRSQRRDQQRRQHDGVARTRIGVVPLSRTTSPSRPITRTRAASPQRRTFIFSGGRQIPTITLPTEELGTLYRLPNIALLDISIQKSFAVIRGQKATLRINVFNALNNNAVTARTMTSGRELRHRDQRPAAADCRVVGDVHVLQPVMKVGLRPVSSPS